MRELGEFTLAVEQVAVQLGLHPEILPSAFLAGLKARGLPSVDSLGKSEDVSALMLHQEKQLSIVLDATLALLDAPGRTALRFAALLPPDNVPWRWLKSLTLARHPEMGRSAPDEPDAWLVTRRQLEGLRLLTSGDHPELARLHRLLAAHFKKTETQPEDNRELAIYLTQRAWDTWRSEVLTEFWELDALRLALPPFLQEGALPQLRDLAKASLFLSDKIRIYRNLRETNSLLEPAYRYLQALAASDPSNAGWQRDLSVSQNKLGDVLRAQGDLAGALTAYRESLAVIQRLMASDPSNAVWQRDLGVSQIKLGDALSAQGDLAGALTAYRESLAVFQRLAASDPSNAGRQRDLSVSQERIGNALRAQGDLAGSLTAYRESLAVRQRLAASDPSNTGWQRGLCASYWRLAMMAEQAGASDAQEWWLKAYETLSGMKQHGIMLPTDEQYLEQLKQKVGR